MVNLGLNVFFTDENVRCRVDGDRRGLLVAALEPAITAQIYIGSPMVHTQLHTTKDFGIPCAYTYNTTLLNIVMGRVSVVGLNANRTKCQPDKMPT